MKDSEESKDIEENEEEDDIPLAYWFVLRKFMGEKTLKTLLQKTVCESYEIKWDLPVSVRNKTKNNNDSDN